MSHFEVLTDSLMGSDHAPIMCVLSFNNCFKIDVKTPESRFNFNKADWNRYGHALDTLISELDLENVM